MLQSKCSDLPFKLFGKMIAVLDSTLTSPDQNPNKETNEKSSPHQEDSLVVDPRPDEVQEIMLLEKSNGWELKMPTDQNVEETLEANEYMPMGKKSNCNKVVLRKPDKLLPCPRCDSGETKFCYYNNYNVNQPRHFCKNCQRYWTAGGTLRNVPVGAGRRKNKHSTLPHVNHINFDPPQSVTPSFSVPSPMTSSVISFGLEQCNDAAQALFKNPVISSAVESNSNLVCGPPNKICTTNRDAEMETRETKTKEIPPNRDGNWWINGSSPWASYSCNGAWSTSVNASSETSLGKHARCSQLQSERSLLLPRTLRINDGKQGSESSIWKSVRVETKCGSGVFKAFQRSDRVESTDNKHICATSSTAHFMNANPAAHTRSRKCLRF